MRGWGVTVLVTAAGCVFLPWPLNLILAAVVMVAAIGAGAQSWDEYKRDLEAKSKAETADHRDWVAEMKALDDAAWERLADAVGIQVDLIHPGELRLVDTERARRRMDVLGERRRELVIPEQGGPVD